MAEARDREASLVGTMFDAVNPANLPADAPAVAGYLDGPRSQWPSSAWNRWTRTPHLVISVLADDRANTLDAEYGNAPNAQVAAAARARQDRGQWTVCYSNRSNLDPVCTALRAAGCRLMPAQSFPAPGVYLWIADPTGEAHLDVAEAPVQPVAVQYRWDQTTDTSMTWGSFPPTPPPAGKEPIRLAASIVGGCDSSSGTGYYLVGADGGVFTFGAAMFYGSMGGHPLAAPVVGMSITPAGKGYRLWAADGGVFTFGDATFHGSIP